MARAAGSQDVTVPELRRYLKDNYQEASDTTINGLIVANAEDLEKAIRVFRSHTHYVGDKYAEAAGWTPIPEDENTTWDNDEPDDDPL